MMSSGEYLKLTGDKMVHQRKPTMKSVFSGKFFSSNNNKSTMSEASSTKHSHSRDELSAMKITALKSLVKEHNLHNQIKGYSTMKKAGLVEALMDHSNRRARGRPKKDNEPPPAPKKIQAVARTKKSTPNPVRKNAQFLQEHQEMEQRRQEGDSKPKRGRPKKRIAPTLISSETGKPAMKSKGGGGSRYADVVSDIARKASSMDQSKRGKKLISNKAVKPSKEPKTKNDYRTGRNFI
jgi:hypothetical protein